MPEKRNRLLAVPQALADFQEEFGQAVAAPFQFDDEAKNWRTRSETYPPTITEQMEPRPDCGLDGVQRLSTYNEQYWFRLFTTMRKEYPLLNRLTGAWDFNRLVTDYLHAFPSHSQSLRDLSNQLGTYLAGDHRWQQPLLRQAAHLDYLYICAFDALQLPKFEPAAMTATEQGKLGQTTLRLQPHWFLFEEQWPLVHLRQAIVTGDDDGQVELESARRYWAIYRSGLVCVQSLGPLQFRLLAALRDGLALEDAIAGMETSLSEEQRLFLAENIGSWFAHWVALGWFAGEQDNVATVGTG